MQSIVKKYTIKKLIGTGSFAQVFLACRISDGKQVAIKQIKKKDKKQTLKTDIECQIMKKTMKQPHPNIIQLEELAEDDHSIYIVEEYAARGDLLAYLQDSQISEEEVKRLMRGILSAVFHLHSLGIVHRDLKLENVLLDEEMNPKVSDFGLSCYWQPFGTINSFCGSPMYCAPEVILKRPYMGPETDVWACGVMLFACMWNRFPFALAGKDDTALRAMLLSVLQDDVQMPPVTERGCCAVRGLVNGMMKRDKDLRMTISEVMEHSWLKEEDSCFSSEDKIASSSSSSPSSEENIIHQNFEHQHPSHKLHHKAEKIKHRMKNLWYQIYYSHR